MGGGRGEKKEEMGLNTEKGGGEGHDNRKYGLGRDDVERARTERRRGGGGGGVLKRPTTEGTEHQKKSFILAVCCYVFFRKTYYDASTFTLPAVRTKMPVRLLTVCPTRSSPWPCMKR